MAELSREMIGLERELRFGWERRSAAGWLKSGDAVRVFHGPGEGSGPLRGIAIDRFGEHAWITEWETDDAASGPGANAGSPDQRKAFEALLAEFLQGRGVRSAVALWRPQKGIPEEPKVLFGDPPAERFECGENGARYWIQLRGVRHPGLFLDHAPLRAWLRESSRGLRVLNTFAYTGSLSVACGLGGAEHVTTLDLSRPTTEWAHDNWKLNGLPEEKADFIFGDVFEWLPKFAKRERSFDLVILDPPSFSRGKKGTFSTSKDLVSLHELAMSLLAPRGFLVTSINSANVSWAKFEADWREAAGNRGMRFEKRREVELPETFPVRGETADAKYLKGWVLQRT